MADLTRHEQFLNHIAHPDEPAPTPQTREEFLLKEIAENKDDNGLPDYSEASEGDVLSIDSNGDPAWAPPSGGGGGGYDFEIVIDDDNALCNKSASEIYAMAEREKGAYILGHGAKVRVVYDGGEEELPPFDYAVTFDGQHEVEYVTVTPVPYSAIYTMGNKYYFAEESYGYKINTDKSVEYVTITWQSE